MDTERVRRLVGSIERWRSLLGEEPQDDYRRRYAVQSAAQACIDLANHLIASEGWRVPRDDGDAFAVLAEHGVVEDVLARRLSGLAGLRNLLVHLYDEVDDGRVAREARDGLDDLAAFALAVVQLLEQE